MSEILHAFYSQRRELSFLFFHIPKAPHLPPYGYTEALLKAYTCLLNLHCPSLTHLQGLGGHHSLREPFSATKVWISQIRIPSCHTTYPTHKGYLKHTTLRANMTAVQWRSTVCVFFLKYPVSSKKELCLVISVFLMSGQVRLAE